MILPDNVVEIAATKGLTDFHFGSSMVSVWNLRLDRSGRERLLESFMLFKEHEFL